jgi:hypothetical protein
MTAADRAAARFIGGPMWTNSAAPVQDSPVDEREAGRFTARRSWPDRRKGQLRPVGCTSMSTPAFEVSALIRAAIAGSRRSLSRRRLRQGPDAPGRAAQLGADLGVRHRRVLDEQGDELLGAARGQARERLPQHRVALGPEQLRFRRPVIVSGISGECRRASRFRAACRTRPHSRWVVVASQPGSAAGSRSDASWPTNRIQTLWPTSSASARPSRYLRQMDHISGAYRSTSSSHACFSPFLARITRAVGSSRIAHRVQVSHSFIRRVAASPSATPDIDAVARGRPLAPPPPAST